MFILKGCPKCHGDLVAETGARRIDDADVTCIQCGYYLRPDEQRGLLGRFFTGPRRLQPVPVYARR